ncbi:hypothetical protein, partial [Nocardia farcinica]|uniref:hypothetical protein n=1 Tax=Nocardia farcinica TaxID=37329 RepID=UPI001145C763
MALPYWIDDHLIDTTAHQLQIEHVETASAVAGRDLWTGSCTCGSMTPTPPWDDYAIREVFDLHMQLIQVAAR